MNEKIRYSVIIPVYNSETTIERCLDSLLSHIPQSAELIVINDGSKDSSGAICASYAKQHTCVQYYAQDNAGVSFARNFGLNHARGEYILFADSDDYVTDDYWESLERMLGEFAPDMLQHGLYNADTSVYAFDSYGQIITGEERLAKTISQMMRTGLFYNLQAHTFKAEIIRKYHMQFDTTLAIGEDTAFVFAYAMKIKSFMAVNQVLYLISTDNGESLSRKRRDYLAQQLMRVNKSLVKALSESDYSAEGRKSLEGAVAWLYYRSAYSSCKELKKYSMPPSERWKRIREICGNYSLKELQPKDIRCWSIAIPVVFRMALPMDILIHLA